MQAAIDREQDPVHARRKNDQQKRHRHDHFDVVKADRVQHLPGLDEDRPGAGGQATLLSWKNGQIKAQNNLGAWYLWAGNSWVPTTPP